MKSLDCLSKESILLLKKNKLLKTLIKRELIESILSKVSIEKSLKEETIKKFVEKLGGKGEQSLEDWLSKNNLTISEMEQLALTPIQLNKYCKDHFSHKVESIFLERKNDLDIVVYSLIRTQNKTLANELYFRILGKEDEFGNLAAKYSEGPEKNSRGVIGPINTSKSHPLLTELLRTSPVGIVQPPVSVGNSYLVVRVELYEPAQLDNLMREKMRQELFEQWIEKETSKIRNHFLNIKLSKNKEE